ncbi:MAG TPA: hypothetical protein VFO98_11915 [Marmoricola sp.]|jgi:O-antigen/teichoic acid export membrane protein|nr:hypothetical protein [Marmoricola sp.]
MADGRGERSATRSTALVGIGLIVLGVSASAFLVLAGRAVGARDFTALAVLWTLVYTVGLGLFVPFEQEVSRAVAHRVADGQGVRPVVLRTAQLALALLAVTTVLTLAAYPVVIGWLDGWSFHVAMFLLACACLAAQYISRGLFSGTGHFGSYAVQLGTEGAVRLLGCTALLLLHVSDPRPYAALLAVSPLLSLLVTLPAMLRLWGSPGPPAALAEVSVNLGWLLGSSLSAQGLANLGTLAIRVLTPDTEAAAAGHFLAGFTIARSPLFLFAAVQAVLLPSMVGQLARGHLEQFRRRLRLTLLVTAGIAGAGVVGSLAIGPWVLGLFFGEGYVMSRQDMTFLAFSTGIYMLALVLQPALIAMSRHRANAIGWLCGVAAFGLVLVLPVDPFLVVEIGLTVGALVAVALLLWSVTHHADTLAAGHEETDTATYRLGME